MGRENILSCPAVKRHFKPVQYYYTGQEYSSQSREGKQMEKLYTPGCLQSGPWADSYSSYSLTAFNWNHFCSLVKQNVMCRLPYSCPFHTQKTRSNLRYSWQKFYWLTRDFHILCSTHYQLLDVSSKDPLFISLTLFFSFHFIIDSTINPVVDYIWLNPCIAPHLDNPFEMGLAREWPGGITSFISPTLSLIHLHLPLLSLFESVLIKRSYFEALWTNRQGFHNAYGLIIFSAL